MIDAPICHYQDLTAKRFWSGAVSGMTWIRLLYQWQSWESDWSNRGERVSSLTRPSRRCAWTR
jgi:hypothetical protein